MFIAAESVCLPGDRDWIVEGSSGAYCMAGFVPADLSFDCTPSALLVGGRDADSVWAHFRAGNSAGRHVGETQMQGYGLYT
jgi:hypothetical protein